MAKEEIEELNDKLLQEYYKTKDIKIMADIMQLNDKLNFHMAHKYFNLNISVEDLASTAKIGMIKAIKSFKPEKNIKFVSYATICMNNEILQLNRKLNKEINTESLDREVTTNFEGESSLHNIVEDCCIDIEKSYELKESCRELKNCIEKLSDRDREIVKLIYWEGKNQREVGELVGLSQSHVCRVVDKILAKLRRSMGRM